MSLRCSTYIDYEQLRERGPEGEAELVGAVSGVAAGGEVPRPGAVDLRPPVPRAAEDRAVLLAGEQRELPADVRVGPRSIFPFYNLITPTPTAETDQIITRRIAEQLTKVSDQENTSFGFVLRGFPFNTSQALLLDRYLNGVNLAIYLRSANESPDFTASIQPLLNYYSERVTPPTCRDRCSNSPTVRTPLCRTSRTPSRKLGSTSRGPPDSPHIHPTHTIITRTRAGERTQNHALLIIRIHLHHCPSCSPTPLQPHSSHTHPNTRTASNSLPNLLTTPRHIAPPTAVLASTRRRGERTCDGRAANGSL